MSGVPDDERHRREEADRRAKRKLAQSKMSDAEKEKRRKRKEHARKTLQKHGAGGGGDAKRAKTGESGIDTSTFQDLFTQRAKGFHIDFRFRNAPPRPPVGPCFVGNGLDGALADASRYRPMNAVEVMYRWKLHNEADLGVPLAPSAMDPGLYKSSDAVPELPAADLALLEWTGSLGDTAAEELKKRRDHDRASARLALVGKSPSKFTIKSKSSASASTTSNKKAFSRVLDETMQSWMKKTTYLSNDYTRKVHDFKSLAQTKAQLAEDLDIKQQSLSRRRKPEGIAETFKQVLAPVVKHPTRKHLKPVSEMPFLPNLDFWGHTFTHVIMDKTPGDEDKLGRSYVANVHQKDTSAGMSCQLFVPASGSGARLQAIQQYDLDVVPLKEEDIPHFNFCILIDKDSNEASYLPISSRVNLSTGRPLKKRNLEMLITRRDMSTEDQKEFDEKIAEIGDGTHAGGSGVAQSGLSTMGVDSDDDSGSDNEGTFMNTNKTIVAED